MEGIAIQSNLNTARNSQLLGRSKGTNGPRKVLAEIQNVQPNKAVSFDAVKPSVHKSVKKSTHVNRSIINTPGARTSKSSTNKSNVKTPGIKSVNRGKGAGNSIKIYEDTKFVSKKLVSQAKSNYDIPDNKAYMPPCTDREYRVPLPDYVGKVSQLKPTYVIDYFSKDRDILPSDEYVERANAEYMKTFSTKKDSRCTADKLSTDVDLLPMLSNLQLTDSVLSTDDYSHETLSHLKLLDEDEDKDEDVLLEMRDDESFSLDMLDIEIRAAGLDLPEW